MDLYTTLLLLISVLINVAFITLLERKILGLSQARLGPNKVSLFGLLQPFSDAIKLLANQEMTPFKSNLKVFMLSPMVSLSLMLVLWLAITTMPSLATMKYGMIFIILMMGMGVYPLMMMGWSSNSKYAMMGALRGIAQTISYEISLALSFLVLMMYTSSINLPEMSKLNSLESGFFLFPLIVMVLFISCVAETNRTPFDFSEGESELVSGFNVEYSSGLFALIFMAEYGMILFFSLLLALLMTHSSFYSKNFMLFFILLMVWIILRATFPRYRYDKLMNLAWKTLLPLSLIFLTLSISQMI